MLFRHANVNVGADPEPNLLILHSKVADGAHRCQSSLSAVCTAWTQQRRADSLLDRPVKLHRKGSDLAERASSALGHTPEKRRLVRRPPGGTEGRGTSRGRLNVTFPKTQLASALASRLAGSRTRPTTIDINRLRSRASGDESCRWLAPAADECVRATDCTCRRSPSA